MRPRKKNISVVALDKRRGRVSRDIMLRPAVGAYRPEQIGIRVLPGDSLSLRVEARQELLRDVEIDASVLHAHAPAVEVILVVVLP